MLTIIYKDVKNWVFVGLHSYITSISRSLMNKWVGAIWRLEIKASVYLPRWFVNEKSFDFGSIFLAAMLYAKISSACMSLCVCVCVWERETWIKKISTAIICFQFQAPKCFLCSSNAYNPLICPDLSYILFFNNSNNLNVSTNEKGLNFIYTSVSEWASELVVYP